MNYEILAEIEEHCGTEPDTKWLAEHYHYIPELVEHIRDMQIGARNAQMREIPNYFQRRNTR